MKAIDRYTIDQIQIPSAVLMERAAWAVTEEVIQIAAKKDRIWVVCGNGNNGADGIAIARMLTLLDYQVEIFLAGEPHKGTEEYQLQLKIAKNLDIPIRLSETVSKGRCDLLIDAIFGVGLDREIDGALKEQMSILTAQKPAFTVAVDLPSGIHSDTGQVMGIALRSDLTVTFGYEKIGTVLYPGRIYSGKVVVKDIGFPKTSLKQAQPDTYAYDRSDLLQIPARPPYSNKGTFGKILLIAGSHNMSGAAYLSALAAYRSGAGLVKIMTTEDNRVILQEQLPEAILVTFDPEKDLEEPDHFRKMILEQCHWASVIVMGPGLGKEKVVRTIVETVLTHSLLPVVLDADGLNAVAACKELTSLFHSRVIVTPHLGEMSRLCGRPVEEIQGNLLATAREYGDRFGVTCVLKDTVTVTACRDKTAYLNTSGSSAMAKAGSGDVLTGMIAGLLALGMECEKAAALGVYLHGVAGEEAARCLGEHHLLARDLTDYIPGGRGKQKEAER